MRPKMETSISSSTVQAAYSRAIGVRYYILLRKRRRRFVPFASSSSLVFIGATVAVKGSANMMLKTNPNSDYMAS